MFHRFMNILAIYTIVVGYLVAFYINIFILHNSVNVTTELFLIGLWMFYIRKNTKHDK